METELGPGCHLPQHSCPPGFPPAQDTGSESVGSAISLQPAWALGNPVPGTQTLPLSGTSRR